MAITRDKLIIQSRRMLYTLKKVQQLPNLPSHTRTDVEKAIRDAEGLIGEEVAQEEVRPGERGSTECIKGQGFGKCRCNTCLDARFAAGALTPSALW